MNKKRAKKKMIKLYYYPFAKIVKGKWVYPKLKERKEIVLQIQ